jgi:ABC-2 type transport system ATP-binding protein
MSAPVIEVKNLHRRFAQVEAVQGLNFTVQAGQVVGFIGANGAGKTTTMRMMATLDLPTEGEIIIAGYDVVNYPEQARRALGWMPDNYGTYENMTVWEYLDFYGRAYGFASTERARRVQEVMEFADLTEIQERPMNRLSKGMGQRLCFGRTLIHDPQVLILDEPAAGLDPKARIEFKNLVRLLRDRGKTIFISSHILSELGEMCDTLLFIDRGRMVHLGSAEALKQGDQRGQRVMVQLAGNVEKLRQWVAMHPLVLIEEERRDGARLRFEVDDDTQLAAQLRQMIVDGLPVVDFHREERKLEEAFVEMLKKVNGPTL